MELALKNRLEMAAVDNGFSIVLGESDGWMVFQAHVVPSRVALSADADGHFLVGTSHAGVANELALEMPEANAGHEGFYSFAVQSSAELFRIVGRIWSLAQSLPDEPLAEFERLVQTTPSTTETERLRKERIGQDVFRKALMRYWEGACAVTSVRKSALLRASHITPWADCPSDAERLNVHNGILLVATLDAAFDQGLVSFSDDGQVIISPTLSPEDCCAASIDSGMRLRRINDEIRARLSWHRTHLFRTSL